MCLIMKKLEDTNWIIRNHKMMKDTDTIHKKPGDDNNAVQNTTLNIEKCEPH